jgi:hypothetical protein
LRGSSDSASVSCRSGTCLVRQANHPDDCDHEDDQCDLERAIPLVELTQEWEELFQPVHGRPPGVDGSTVAPQHLAAVFINE